MRIFVTRDSVAVGDDLDAPHRLEMEGGDSEDLGAVIGMVLASGYLPNVAGGKATWSVASNVIVAVVAQQWQAPKLVGTAGPSDPRLDGRDGTLHLHFSYHGQHDPDTVWDILRRLRLRAI